MKKNLFTILCLVGTLGAAGLTSCGGTSSSSSTPNTSDSSTSKPEEKITISVTKGEVSGTKSNWSATFNEPNAWGGYSGTIKVTIDTTTHIVEKITAEGKLISDKDTWPDENAHKSFQEAKNGIAKLEGKTVNEVLSLTSNLELETEKGGLTDETMIITGATQTSKRILLSVDRILDEYVKENKILITVTKGQDVETKETWTALFNEPNAWGGYTGKINVTIDNTNDTILKVTAEGKLISDKDTWPDDNAHESFEKAKNSIAKLEGKTVNEVLNLTSDLELETEKGGLTDETMIISGATQTSKRILLSVDRILDAYVAAK